MHVYVQKSMRTTLPSRPAGVSGSELSQPVAPDNEGSLLSTVAAISAHRPERGADLLGEELRLLPRGEVPAALGLVEVRDVGIALLDPAARGEEDLAGELREADRDRHLRGSLARCGRLRLRLSALPVRAGRRGSGAGQPVQRDVVEHVVSGEIAGGLPV